MDAPHRFVWFVPACVPWQGPSVPPAHGPVTSPAPAVARDAVRSLASPVMVLRGVGPERVFQLGRLGIHTVGDLLLHAPRRYEDRRRFITIRELELGKSATVFGKIIAAGVKRYRGGARSVYEFVIEDGSARLHCRWCPREPDHKDP